MPIQMGFGEALSKMGTGLSDALREYQQGKEEREQGNAGSDLDRSGWIRYSADSWKRSFTEDYGGRTGANKAAILRNLAAVRPEWSEEKRERFYKTQIEPEVLRTIEEVPVRVGEPERHEGLRQRRSGGSFFRAPHRRGKANAGGGQSRVGEIELEPGDEEEDWIIAHEYGHAVDWAVARALNSHTKPGGEYGDVGADLIKRNQEAMGRAFPFMGQKKLPGVLNRIQRSDKPGALYGLNRAVRGGLERVIGLEDDPEGFAHSRSYVELINAARDWRRMTGKDPTPEEVKREVLSSKYISRPGRVDIRRHYRPHAEDIRGVGLRPDLSRSWGTEDADEGDVYYPGGPEERLQIEQMGPKLPYELLPGTPSPEDIAGALREISYAEPMEGALTRAFG